MPTRSSTTFTVTTSKKIKKVIDEWTEAGNYKSSGAFIEEAIREKLHRSSQDRVEALLLEALDAGPALPYTPANKKRVLERLETRSKAKRLVHRAKSSRGAA